MNQRIVTKRVTGVARWGLVASVFVLCGHAAGQWIYEQDLPGPLGYFGGSAAISGDVAIVGAELVDDVATDAGAAYVYRRSGDGSWSLEDELLAGDGAAEDLFGEAVAVSGDLALVGAPGRDEIGTDSGAVYVFRHAGGGVWTLEQKLVQANGGPTGGAFNGFGSSVAFTGSLAIVGAAGDSTKGAFAGAAHGFRRASDGTWTQEAKLVASDGQAEDSFGAAVAMDGIWAVVGAPFDDDRGADSGSAYVYRRNSNGVWQKRAKLTRPGGKPFEFFGISVDISGLDAIVGAPLDLAGPAEGSATIFHRSGNTWSKVGRLRATNPVPFEAFGSAVAISGDNALVGAPDQLLQGGPGRAFVFTRNQDGTWPITGGSELSAPGSPGIDSFGLSVALAGDFAVVGAPSSSNDAGETYAFRDNTPRPPSIGSLGCAPDPVAQGQVLTLTANDVTDQNGADTVVQVRFYRDSDASGAWEDTDQVLATDSTPGDGWTWVGVVPNSWDSGANTFFARARDDTGEWSEAAPATCAVWAEPGGGTPPVPPVYDTPPAGNTKMVVLVHGWNTTQAEYDNFWSPLAAEISGVIPDAANWSVWAYNWVLQSQWAEPDLALTRSWMLGLALGQDLAALNLEHVHFIAHSAGSGLIGLASSTLSDLSPTTTIHTTFLDPWAGVLPLHPYSTLYGGFADWSDNYYARDDTGPWTALRDLPNAHNVDVTGIDPDFVAPFSSHAWPRCFYGHSVNGTLHDDCSAPTPANNGLYGFPLSFEWQGANWNTVIAGFPVGTHVTLPQAPLPVIGGDPVVESSFAVRDDATIDASSAPSIVNGQMAFVGGGFTASAQAGLDPAWITFEAQTAAGVNFISFDADFASGVGAEGLLTVYLDNTEIGVLDEVFAPAGTSTYRMGTGGGLDPGAHLFAFRLDEFAGIQSSLDVSNIATGSAEFIVESVSGAVAGEHAGWAIANAGDVDQDGYDDIVIGAPFNDENGAAAGKVYVLSARTGDLLFDVVGTPGSRHGWSVAGAGDVNLDGHADVIVGAPFHNNKRGRAYVYSGADGQELFRKLGAGDGDQLGYAVAGGVDVNEDGHDDVIFAAPWNDDAAPNAGQVQIYSGSNASRIDTLTGERKNDRFGTSLAALVKVDADACGDFVVGAPLNDDSGKNAGKVYVYSGKNRSLLYTRTGMRAGDQFGRSVAAAGRIDANERDDFVVGAPLFDKTGASNAGRVFVYSGHTGNLIWAKNGQAANDRSGWSVAGAGDVDGDGVDDVLVGAYLHDTAGVNAGRAYMRSGVSGAALDVFDGAADDDRFGLSLAGIGDVNDDGYDDVLVAAPKNDGIAADSGRVDVFLSSYGLGMPPPLPYLPGDDDAPADDALSGPATSGETASPRSPTGVAALQQVLEHWGPCASLAAGCPGDLNGDGVVDALDLGIALALLDETADDLAAENGDEDLPVDEPVGITFVNDGVLAPREHDGVFTVSDEYAQTAGGALVIEIGGPVPVEQHDMLVVAERAWLAGELVVVFSDGFEPGPGDAFTIVAAGSIDGEFDWIELPRAQRDVATMLLYEDTAVTVCVEIAGGSGCKETSIEDQADSADLTDDGLVDVHDLFAVLRAWGASTGEADLNRDGSVDGLDLLVLLHAWED
jgi:hypothetical protein